MDNAKGVAHRTLGQPLRGCPQAPQPYNSKDFFLFEQGKRQLQIREIPRGSTYLLPNVTPKGVPTGE
jgi:hypothetical protein